MRRYHVLKSLFLRARRLEAGERSALLKSCTADDPSLRLEVEGLLSADERTSGFGTAGAGALQLITPMNANASLAEVPLPSHIGKYEVQAVLGIGAMAIVYKAQQPNPRRDVALKVLLPTTVSHGAIRRFELEAQLLGRLHHPGIAEIYEADTALTDSGRQPFFAMELVRGQPITEYAESRHLDTRERLRLFAKVCEAVEYAHRRGIIHRDLKPGNILVEESGQPKILDFGVADATNADIQATTLRTDVGLLIGTVPYMSPEQVAGDANELDTRSDVYALGVTCYELLTGALPHNLNAKPILEVLRIIGHDSPTPLSARSRRLRGDLETIVGKALEKERERRYGSAADLAADIRRYLAHEPLLAHPPSAWYQFRKAIKRRKAMSIAAASILITVSASAVAMTALYWKSQAHLAAALIAKAEADKARKLAHDEADRENASAAEALRQAQTSERVCKYITSVFTSLGPSSMHNSRASVSDVLASVRERLVESMETEPVVKAALLYQLGRVQIAWGYQDDSRPLFEAALELQRKHLPAGHADTLKTLTKLGLTCLNQGNRRQGEQYIDEALTLLSAKPKPNKKALADALAIKGRILREEHATTEALAYLQCAIALRRDKYAEDSVPVLSLRHCIAMVRAQTGDLESAQGELEEVIQALGQVSTTDRSALNEALRDLGKVLRLRGRLQESEDVLRDAWGRMQDFFGADSTRTLAVLHQLVLTLKKEEKLGEAETLLNEAVASDARPPTYLCVDLAEILNLDGRSQEAKAFLRVCLKRLAASPARSAEATARARRVLKRCLTGLASDAGGEGTPSEHVASAQ